MPSGFEALQVFHTNPMGVAPWTAVAAATAFRLRFIRQKCKGRMKKGVGVCRRPLSLYIFRPQTGKSGEISDRLRRLFPKDLPSFREWFVQLEAEIRGRTSNMIGDITAEKIRCQVHAGRTEAFVWVVRHRSFGVEPARGVSALGQARRKNYRNAFSDSRKTASRQIVSGALARAGCRSRRYRPQPAPIQ